jgi:hypothetical protein
MNAGLFFCSVLSYDFWMTQTLERFSVGKFRMV